MSNVAKLKKQAAEFEQKRQFDKALAVYVKLLDAFDDYADELDVALFNRVGDLMLRQGNVADALDYYEKAVDRYSETGFFNNAIALCNKILRHSPGRASIYYKLGKISAQKGFKNDAKVNFLEYADRMQKAGRVDEAFRALKEFADLCPDQDEIRLMLADQLTRLDRKAEAVEQLQILYGRYGAEGRAADAGTIADRIREIDPAVELKSDSASLSTRKSSDLVFLDLDAPSETPSRANNTVATPAAPVAPPASNTPISPRPAESLVDPLIEAQYTRADIAIDGPEGDTLDAPLSGLSRLDDDAVAFDDDAPSQSVLGLEQTRLADDDLSRTTPTSSLLDLEPTSLDTTPPLHRSNAPTQARRDPGMIEGDLEFDVPPAQPTPIRPTTAQPSIEFGRESLLTPLRNAPVLPPRQAPSTPRGALEGLPLMDLDIPDLPGGTLSAPGVPPTSRAADSTASTVNDLDLLDLDDAAAPGTLRRPSTPADSPPQPSVARRSTLVAMHAVEALKASVEDAPENITLRRDLAEAMLEAGDRSHGIQELETAMLVAERAVDLALAASLAEELARLEPEAVKHHQKRVEYAFRTNDRPRLIEAYLALGDALLRADQADKARTVYQRVIDLSPNDLRAQAAIESLTVAADRATPTPRATPGVRPPVTAPAAPAKPVAPAAPAQPANNFVNLGDWLRDSSGPKDTRMVVAEQEPSGDEEADFADMLRKFKQGVAENVDAEDYQSHYDLAIAFKEMGLLDESIAEFQKALGSPTNRLPTYEALGQCFLDKGQPKLAMSILTRALNERATEEQLVGVLYWLGRAAAELGLASEALTYYQRVFVLDIQFRDVAERMTEVERAAR
jgi:tetratricopeptide (TPR) repeat protein